MIVSNVERYGGGTGFHINLQVSDKNRPLDAYTLQPHIIPWTGLTDLLYNRKPGTLEIE